MTALVLAARQNTLSVGVFGLFFPLFLFCLPCYQGSGIHIDNLNTQVEAKNSAEAQRFMYRENNDSERKY